MLRGSRDSASAPTLAVSEIFVETARWKQRLVEKMAFIKNWRNAASCLTRASGSRQTRQSGNADRKRHT